MYRTNKLQKLCSSRHCSPKYSHFVLDGSSVVLERVGGKDTVRGTRRENPNQ